MIQNTTTTTQLLNEISHMKLTVAQMKHLLLDKLQVGSEIEGQLTTKDGQLLLDTKMGIKLPISLCEGQINLGEWVKFMVLEKGEKGLMLKVLADPALGEMPKQENVVEKVMRELQLPKEVEVEKSIAYLLEKQLPIDRQMILKVFYLHKQLQLPLPVLINVLEKQGDINSPLMEAMKVARDIGKAMPLMQLEHFIKEQPLIKEDLLKLVTTLSKDEYILKDSVGRGSDVQKDMIFPKVDDVGVEKSIEKGNVRLMEDNKQPQKLLADLVKLELSELKELVTKLFDEKTKLFLETLKTLPPVERGEYLKETPVLKEMLQVLEESQLPKESKMQLLPIKETFQQLTQMQHQGELMLLPIVHQKQLKDVEIYLFKPKKNKAKQKKDMYVVVALDMPMLQHLEIHLHHMDKQLSIQIQVEDQQVQKHIQQHMIGLIDQITKLGYQVSQSSCTLKQESTKLALKHKLQVEHTLQGVDYKV